MKHGGLPRFEASRIHVWAWFNEGINIPITCQQCSDAACVNVCPTGAMHHTSSALVEVDANKCIRCRMCTMACPFGNAMYDAQTDSIVKCDTCQGDPTCVKQCPAQALEYVDASQLTTSRQKIYVTKLKEIVQGDPV
jgi:Fe-S-cluster-containing hydrogenase component 2